MNAFAVAFFAALALSSAHVIPYTGVISHDIVAPVSSDTILQGPSTKTVVAGPDGSKIEAEAPGGIVHTNTQHAAVKTVHSAVVASVPVAHEEAVVVNNDATVVEAYSAPVVAKTIVNTVPVAHEVVAPVVAKVAPVVSHVAPVVGTKTSVVHTSLDQVHPSPAVAAPVAVEVKSAPLVAVTRTAPVVAHSAFVAHGAPVVAHAAPLVEARYVAPAVVAHAAPVAVAHAAPAVVATKTIVSHAAPAVVATHGVVAHATPYVAHGVVAQTAKVHHVDPAFVAHGPHGALVAPGTGIEGEYQHDYTETLYDDGTYKGEFYNAHH